MFSKIQFGLVAGAVALSLGAGMAYAALSGDEAITARQTCMKANGAGMKVMVPIIKGEAAYDAAAVQTALGAMDAACAKWNEFWPADSMTSTAMKTKALEAIWKDPKGFEAAGGAYYTAFTALKATKDEAGFKGAFEALGKGCGGCHEKFRAPMN
jgi:cytochrome c556